MRLNETDTHDRTAFESAGIAHHDLYFDHSTAPPGALVARFLDICDREEAVAVHCRAGLGRTLVALRLMKHAGFGADEAMGWRQVASRRALCAPMEPTRSQAHSRGRPGERARLRVGPA